MIRRLALLPPTIAVAVSSCGLETHGPWVDQSGRRMQGNEVMQFDGSPVCDHQGVTFLRFFGSQYARDLGGVLGELRSPVDDRPLSFELLDVAPLDTSGTGIVHAEREIYVGADRPDYLYLRHAEGTVERWPRAEVACASG